MPQLCSDTATREADPTDTRDIYPIHKVELPPAFSGNPWVSFPKRAIHLPHDVNYEYGADGGKHLA